MKTLSILFLTALLPLPVAAQTAPPLLPATVGLHDLQVPATTRREFDIDVPRAEKWLPYELVAAAGTPSLSGTLLLSVADGAPLREIALDGRSIVGGVVAVPPGAPGHRIRVSVQGGAQDMRADLALLTSRAQLKSGQPHPVYPQRQGSDALAQTLELRLSKPSDVDLRTWGGDASIRLRLQGPVGGDGSAASVCDDQGDAWRRCVAKGLAAGIYQLTVEGSGAPVQVLGSWRASEPG